MIDIGNFLEGIALYSGITIAVVQVIKMALDKYVPDRFYPLISVLIGLALGIFVAQWPFLLALIVGLVASGTYDLGKHTAKGIAERI